MRAKGEHVKNSAKIRRRQSGSSGAQSAAMSMHVHRLDFDLGFIEWRRRRMAAVLGTTMMYMIMQNGNEMFTLLYASPCNTDL